MGNDAGVEGRRRFAGMYEAHRLHVLAYCVRRTNRADAADACSETFLVAWRRLDEVPAEPGTLPYLYGIARKVLGNQRRSLQRRSRLDGKLRELGVAEVADAGVVVLQSAQHRQVVDAIRRLKPVDRELLMLSAWEELPRAVIAEMMGMTKAAVDQRIHRSYERLARMLGVAATEPSSQTTGSAQR
jgi:RNA polymerase sigma-70 factor (ECF subfamily)